MNSSEHRTEQERFNECEHGFEPGFCMRCAGGDEDIERAIEMLQVAARFLRENAYEVTETIYYDEADCDGQCLADDCETAALCLESRLHESRLP